MTPTEIVLERETANDETATVVAVHVRSGEMVLEGDVLFDIENSKATQEVVAPAAGLLAHTLALGDTVEFGVSLARIVPAGRPEPEPALAPAEPSLTILEPPARPTEVTLTEPALRRPTVLASHEARTLSERFGIDLSAVGGDLITTAELRAYMRGSAAELVAAPELRPMGRADPTQEGEAVSGAKRAEIEALSAGAGNTMLSVLGVTLGAVHIARPPGDLLAGRLTDVIIYEAARLMRQFPKLNARYVAGQVVFSPVVHAGLAIDGGGRLVVYGIENADQLSVPEIAQAIGDAAARYVEGQLTAGEMTRATFTVTDLSEGMLDFVLPLLPKGQSCILGITRSSMGEYRIYAGFDHRVTEGREVSQFLGELQRRVQSFGRSQPATVCEPSCSYCDRTAASLDSSYRDKGLLKVVDRHGREALCCTSCWDGW